MISRMGKLDLCMISKIAWTIVFRPDELVVEDLVELCKYAKYKI